MPSFWDMLDSVTGALGGPWIDRAVKQTADDLSAYQTGGVPALMANTQGTQDLAGGFGGNTKSVGAGIRAYHGSPYDFDKFDLSKIGTGEGAQSYGHGLYFAENPTVAAEYRRQLAGGSEKLVGGQPYDSSNPEHLAASLTQTFKGDRSIPIKELTGDIANPALTASARQNYADTIKILNSGQPLLPVEMKPRGKMYEVNINAKPEQFLDWDKPIGEQPKPVFEALQKDWLAHPDLNQTGAEIYDAIGNGLGYSHYTGGPVTSQTLREAGIPGIKYLDQGSRGAKKGTSNYVVFNPDIVDIRKKWAILLASMGGAGASALAPPQQQAPIF